MTSSTTRAIAPKPAPLPAQRSIASPFEGRGRSRAAMRRAHGRRSAAEMHQFRADFPDLWSGFLRSQFRSREQAAAYFEVTFQTACNWWDGVVRPSGDKVAQAAIEFGPVFLAAMGVQE